MPIQQNCSLKAGCSSNTRVLSESDPTDESGEALDDAASVKTAIALDGRMPSDNRTVEDASAPNDYGVASDSRLRTYDDLRADKGGEGDQTSAVYVWPVAGAFDQYFVVERLAFVTVDVAGDR